MRRIGRKDQPEPLDVWLGAQTPAYLQTLDAVLSPLRGSTAESVRAGLDDGGVSVPEPHLSTLAQRVAVLPSEVPATAIRFHARMRTRP